MNLKWWSENAWKLVTGAVLLIIVSAVAVSSVFDPISPDTFWHLQMGKDWIENGLSPWIDHYSFTYNGREMPNSPYAFQAVLYLAVSLFELEAGIVVLRMFCFVVILWLVFLLLRQLKAQGMLYAVVFAIVAYLFQLRAVVRPELVGYVFSILALMLYFRAGDRASLKNVLPMALLMLVWTNYHTSVIGYVIFAGFFLDCAVSQFKSRVPAAVWATWFGLGVLVVAAGFLNPGFEHPILGSISFPSQYKLWINEYLPPAPFDKYRSAGMAAVLTFTLIVLLLAYRQRKFGFLFIAAILIYSAFMMRRMIAPAGIVITLMGASLIAADDFRSRLYAFGRKGAQAMILSSSAMLAALLYSVNLDALNSSMSKVSSTATFPEAMVDHMLEQGRSGRIFNDYGIGGYLIYRLSSQNQVYIDGRTNLLYPLEHAEMFFQAYKSSKILASEVLRYGIQHVVVKDGPRPRLVANDLNGFGLDFIDGRHALYTKESPSFPVLGNALSRPACWHPDMLHQLIVERGKMEETLPSQAALFAFADFVIGYGKAKDRLAFLDASIEETEWSDEMRRFAGFRFLESGKNIIAANLFGGIRVRLPQDSLAAAIALVKKDNLTTVLSILRELSGMHSGFFTDAELALFSLLCNWVLQQDDLGSKDRIFFLQLSARLPVVQDQSAQGEFHLDLLCPKTTETVSNQRGRGRVAIHALQ
jgi:hypothetical protein